MIKCEICGTTEDLTKDHIVPKWLMKRLPAFGSKLKGGIHGKHNSNIQTLCRPCNSEKGGKIIWESPRTREVMENLMDTIRAELSNYKIPFHD